MKKVIPIEEDEQEIAIFLPTERFKKSGKAKFGLTAKGNSDNGNSRI